MKKKGRIGAVLTGTIVAASTMAFSFSSFAATTVKAELSPDFTIVIDGKERTFYSADGEEAHPIVYNGTTYLPLRAIGEIMGKNVNWDESTMTVTLSGSRTAENVKGKPDKNADTETIRVQIMDEFKIVVDGETQKFKDADGNRVYPMLYNGSTYLPLRSIGEIMGKTVSWNADTETVTLGGDYTVTDADSFGSSQTSTSNKETITESEAKEIALEHAGISSKKATFVKSKLDWEDGRRVYEVEFYADDYTEYDYEIDAVTGKILSYDYDAEDYKAPSNSGSYIGEEKAKSIAVSNVKGAGTNNVVKVEFDYDDGRAVYEVKVVYNAMEYEFEIDASNGKILSRDAESIYD